MGPQTRFVEISIVVLHVVCCKVMRLAVENSSIIISQSFSAF
jgi:hypothetical protein